MRFESLEISNFRGFDRLKVEPLARLNLIGGKNDTGKTSVMEAVFCLTATGNPYAISSLNALRGVPIARLDAEAMWASLFHGHNTEYPVEIRARRHEHGVLSLRITVGHPGAGSLSLNGDSAETRTAFSAPIQTADPLFRDLVLDYSDSQRGSHQSRLLMRGTDLSVKGLDAAPLGPSVFIGTSQGVNALQNAERYSQLEAVGQQEEIVELVRQLEPRLKRLAMILSGGMPLVHGDVGEGRLIPVSLMGEGVGKALSVGLAIKTAANGIVLVDEIENGIHYSVMKNVWAVLARIARSANTQVFATTHSWECIRGAYEAMAEDSEFDLSYHRLDRSGSSVNVATYDRETLATALSANLEIR